MSVWDDVLFSEERSDGVNGTEVAPLPAIARALPVPDRDRHTVDKIGPFVCAFAIDITIGGLAKLGDDLVTGRANDGALLVGGNVTGRFDAHASIIHQLT